MDIIDKAAKVIQDGEVVAFPTETVYGLGADATNDEACKKIYELKQRPSFNPLIVHISNIESAKDIAEFNEDALILSKLWPAPLTMVLPLNQHSNICKTVLGGLNTIAVRIPAHPIALALIRKSGKSIAAPSANISGYVSSTQTEHVLNDFGNRILIVNEDALLLDEGMSIKLYNKYGLESTIIDLSATTPTILRLGFITGEIIEEMLGKEISYNKSIMQIKAPGMLEKHYSPKTQIRLNATYLNLGELGLNFGNSKLLPSTYNLSISGNLVEAAGNLYSMLRSLDEAAIENGIKTIAIAPIPTKDIGIAINDRLKRAAF